MTTDCKIVCWGDYVNEPVARCGCGGNHFYIRLNGYGNRWDKIIGTECVDCGQKIDWVVAEGNSAERSGADDGKD